MKLKYLVALSALLPALAFAQASMPSNSTVGATKSQGAPASSTVVAPSTNSGTTGGGTTSKSNSSSGSSTKSMKSTNSSSGHYDPANCPKGSVC